MDKAALKILLSSGTRSNAAARRLGSLLPFAHSEWVLAASFSRAAPLVLDKLELLQRALRMRALNLGCLIRLEPAAFIACKPVADNFNKHNLVTT